MLVKATGTMAATAAKQGAAHQQPSRRPPRGAFIVLEGVDRCGKTTQSKLLLQRLVAAGLAAQAMRFPNRSTATGRIINEYLTMSSSSESDESRRPALDDCAIHLLFSANRWEASRDILETLANGTTIVCDRYAHSGVAFTASKNTVDNNHQHDKNDNNHTQQQQQQQLSLEWCRAPDRGLPAPDAVIYLQLSADQAEERGGYGGERYEKRDMQERVRERFMELYQLDVDEAEKQQQQQKGSVGDADVDPGSATLVPSWTFVDAGQSVEQVQDDVWKAVQEAMHKVRERNKPVGKMFAPGTLQLPCITAVVNDTDQNDTKIVLMAKGSDVENHEPPTATSTTSTGEAK